MPPRVQDKMGFGSRWHFSPPLPHPVSYKPQQSSTCRNAPACPTNFSPPPHQGYKDRRLERLRRGIGPEDLALVESIMPTEVPGLALEELDAVKKWV